MIGISMRVDHAPNYVEPRSALSWDMANMLSAHYGHNWIQIPNLGGEITPYLKKHQIKGLILSGGNDIGQEPLRDQTEIAMIEFSIKNKLPLLAICRGMQMVQSYFGGKLVESKGHVNLTHTIRFNHPNWRLQKEIKVNSYHQFAIQNLAHPLETLAISSEGYIEAALHPNYPIWAIMWHPERPGTDPKIDQFFLNALKEQKCGL